MRAQLQQGVWLATESPLAELYEQEAAASHVRRGVERLRKHLEG